MRSLPVAALSAVFVFAACRDAAPPTQPIAPDVAPAFAKAEQDRPMYIVTFKPRTSNGPELARQLANAAGSTPVYTYTRVLNGFAAPFSSQAAAALLNNPNVESVELDQVVTADVTQTGATWGLDRIDQRALPLSTTYTYDNTGAGITAYIIDTGIRTTHNEFGGRASGGYTAINDANGTNDCHGHGTHVAGTVGGATYGVAKGVSLVAVRVLNCQGSGTNAGVIAGIDWVVANASGPSVANMSLGGGASSTLDNAVANAVAAGITMVVAAGNDNANACNSSPARAPSAITVGATTSSDARASYSNFGSCLDIFAPGSAITSAYYSSNTATATWNGTSMASPHVAGAAALYLDANRSATPGQVASALTSNATSGAVSGAGTGSPDLLLYMGFIAGGGPPPPPPPPAVLVLDGSTSSKGKNNFVSLDWTGATSNITVYRNNAAVTTTSGSSWSENVGKNSGSASYKVCVASNCSNTVSLSW